MCRVLPRRFLVAMQVASMGVPVRRKEIFHPTIIKTPKGETVLDFGQNLAGVVQPQPVLRHAVVGAVTDGSYVCPQGEICDQDQAQTGVDNSYGYDANGNQTSRIINGQSYTLGYDAEGHLVSVSGPKPFGKNAWASRGLSLRKANPRRSFLPCSMT